MFLDQDNMVILRGRLGADAEVRYMQDGTAVANMSLATSQSYKKNGEKKEHTEWHRLVLFGRLVESIKDYLTKGQEVSVVGTLRTRKWTDRDGNDRYTTEIHVVDLRLRGGKNQQNGRGQQSANGHQAGYQQPQQQQPNAPVGTPAWDEVPMDEVPF